MILPFFPDPPAPVSPLSALSGKVRRRALAFAVYVHLTGYEPTRLQSFDSFRFYRLIQPAQEKGRTWELRPETLPLLEGHPMMEAAASLLAEGFVYAGRTRWSWGHYTLRNGVEFRHPRDGRRVVVYADGRVHQHENAEGRWESVELRPGTKGWGSF